MVLSNGISWSNGIAEQTNAILGFKVPKTIFDKKSNLKLVLDWVVPTKNL